MRSFSSYRDRYTVPEFQRVYGWGETELDRLFSDFETAMRGAPGRLFLGTIYLAAPGDRSEALIADGQQRILTATMIHAAARDLAEDAAEADRLHAVLATPGGKDFRFMPRDRDAAFFRTWVQERGSTLLPLPGDDSEDEAEAAELSESQLNIIRNRDAIVERLRKLGPDGRQRLIEFHDRIKLVAITTDTVEEARNAYASTQTRGLRQSETDKLKAELIGDCPPAQRALLAGRWEECEAKLGRDEFTDLFHHLIMVEAERRPQHALEADLFGVFDLPRKVASFIEDVLVPSADAYHRICTAGAATTRKTRNIDAALDLAAALHAQCLAGPGPAGGARVRRRPAPARAVPGRLRAAGVRHDDQRHRPAPDAGALRRRDPRHQEEDVRRALAASRRSRPGSGTAQPAEPSLWPA